MWQGIEVWGNSSTHQYEINGSYGQGYLEMRNGATIENAICAVELWRPGHYNTTGGIIHDDGVVGTPEAEAFIRPYLFFPNPAQDQLHLQYSPDVKPDKVELYDLQGRLVRTQSEGIESINLQGLAPGQYLMKVTLEDGKTYSDKVVKE